MFKISVIVPIYNMEKFLERSLDTFVNQTLEEIEIILVNDASTDSSIDIMEKYMRMYPDKIKIIDLDKNIKQGGAKNRGLEIARGEFVCFFDPDDYVDVTMLEKLYKKAIQTNSDVVDSDYVVVGERDAGSLSYRVGIKSQLGRNTIERNKGLVLDPGTMCCKIYKKTLFDETGIKFPEGQYFEDTQIAINLLINAKKIEKVKEHLYYWSCDNQNSTTRQRNCIKQLDVLRASISILEYFKSIGLYDIYKEELEFRFINIYYLYGILLCIKRFDIIPEEKLYEMREYVRTNFKQYRKNEYYKSSIGFKRDFMLRLNDISPKLLIFFVSTIGKKFRK